MPRICCPLTCNVCECNNWEGMHVKSTCLRIFWCAGKRASILLPLTSGKARCTCNGASFNRALEWECTREAWTWNGNSCLLVSAWIAVVAAPSVISSKLLNTSSGAQGKWLIVSADWWCFAQDAFWHLVVRSIPSVDELHPQIFATAVLVCVTLHSWHCIHSMGLPCLVLSGHIA